jgi:hypothetical protein
MRRLLVSTALALLASAPALGQATSEWRTPGDLPVAVVEVAGGDLEVMAAALPVDASPPAEVAGFPATVTPRRGELLWAAGVPSGLTQAALPEFLRTLSASGAAAVVLVGPVPARELADPLHALDAVPLRPLPRLPCVLADGGIEVRRGSAERVDLTLALPGPDDPRFDMLPALVALVRARLRTAFPDIEVASELHGGCARLHLGVAAGAEGARAVLDRLRRRLAAVPATPPTAEETGQAVAECEGRAARAAMAGRAVAAELAERLALGGSVAGALATPLIDSATLAELARGVLGGRAGFATLVERERIPRDEATRTLDDGALLSLRWIPSETGVVAVALGGVDPRAGRALLSAAADRLARHGWATSPGEILGVPTLAVAASGSAVIAAMEQISDALSAPPPPAADDLAADAARAEGLAERVAADSVSVALALPPELDEGPEAGRKFFGFLQGGGVRTGAPPPGAGLAWSVREGEPDVVGTVEIPPTTAGVVAMQVVRDRLAAEGGVHAFVLAPPGRVVLAVEARGGAHVPAVDARLAALWKAARRPCSPAELTAATHRLFSALFGDAAQATARAAAAVFLPPLPKAEGLLATEPREVNSVLTGLPGWERLPRFARGTAPEVVVPPGRPRGVRKSRPRS